jgi:hypothetical protein
MVLSGGPPMEQKLALRISNDDGDRAVAAALSVCVELLHDSDCAVLPVNQDDLVEGGIGARPGPIAI